MSPSTHKAAGWVLSALALCLLLAAVLLFRSTDQQEAAGQETTTPATTSPATAPPASVPSFFPELEDAFSSATAEAEETPEGIPGLGVTDVLGHLYRYPVEGRFACVGPVPGDVDATLWSCYAPSEGGRPTHEVTVAGDDPRTVLWVQATVRGAADEEAARFFAYVAALCLQDTDDPFNPEAWMGANVASGEEGQVFAQGAEFSVYGTREERTMQVVATGGF